MSTVAVTGAAGSVGRRVTRLLAERPDVKAIEAIDRVRLVPLQVGGEQKVTCHQLDVASTALLDVLDGCDSVVHLADEPGRRTDAELAERILGRVLAAAEQVGCRHVVLLSSALVYGARPDNPVPITEAYPRRPLPDLAYARTKAGLEQSAERWAGGAGADLAVLRPTTTLSERGVSWIAGALRAATSLRPEQLDPPVQFLHHDDLASAVAQVTAQRRTGVFNVAPDGWIGSEAFRTLQAEAELRLPEPINDAWVRVARRVRSGAVEPGLDAYVAHPWVVANDRLRATGWEPAFTNEEAYVLGTPAPMWRTVAQRRRQELLLGATGSAAAVAVVTAGLVGRRFMRR